MPADPDRSRRGGLRSYYLQSPATWGALPLDRAEGPLTGEVRRALAEVAADLTTGQEGAAHCEQLLLISHDALIEEPHLGVAVWVPDPTTGEVAGSLQVDHLVADEPGGVTRPDLYRATVEESIRARGDIVNVEVSQTDLPAGEAVVVLAVGTLPGGAMAQTIVYTVFPDICRDAVQLTFSSPELHLGEQLAEEARLIADSLQVAELAA